MARRIDGQALAEATRAGRANLGAICSITYQVLHTGTACAESTAKLRNRSKVSTHNCNEPKCSAFANVSIVLGVTAVERIPLLLDYALWFASVHLLVPAPDCQCYVRRSMDCRTPVACACGHGCNSSNAFNHAAIARGIRHAAKVARDFHGAPVRGVLFAHMDMWINVRSSLYRSEAPFDSIWVPNHGLLSAGNAPFCAPNGASWHRRVPGYVASSTPQCRSMQLLLPSVSWSVTSLGTYVQTSQARKTRLTFCCFGWVDMYYTPTFALDAFAALTIALSTEFNEVAIPTVAAVLQQQANISWWKVPCSGDCCHQIASPTKHDPRQLNTYCGHKLALDKPQYRSLLMRTLHPNYTRALELTKEDGARFAQELKEEGLAYRKHYSMARNASRVRRCNNGDGSWSRVSWVASASQRSPPSALL